MSQKSPLHDVSFMFMAQHCLSTNHANEYRAKAFSLIVGGESVVVLAAELHDFAMIYYRTVC